MLKDLSKRPVHLLRQGPALLLLIGLMLLIARPLHAQSDDSDQADDNRVLEEVTIVGDAVDVTDTAGSAHVIAEARLEQFEYADIQRIVREIPGVSVQVEDGYGLRPNLSIRGTPSERSSRITLLEDNVLIAPAPYSAPAAYYFPTAGRMRQVEVLKGSSSIKQGPYTVGGAMNFLSTDIQDSRTARANIELAEHETTRLHAVYGDGGENFGWLVEGHLWDSAGFQEIDIVGGDTGLDKDDWMVKLRFNSDPEASVYQQVDLKLQYAKENSDQSYLGLTDGDFASRAYRRYAASQFDNIETEHDQVILRYLASFRNGVSFKATAYSNNHERDWFKTEGLDPDGSDSAETFSRTSWFDVVQAVNMGESVGSLDTTALQAILDGSDTLPGSIQLRSNAREYFSRGIQFGVDWDWQLGSTQHEFEFGLRFHEDEEDRLQRNSNYHQEAGVLVLDDLGLLGNAGNRIQEADATSFFLHDRISWNKIVLTPGIRYENIDQSRTRWEIQNSMTMDPSNRDETNIRDTRQNETEVWIPGLGALYAVNDALALYGGIHKGFTAPSNAPDVDEEESVNYEFGVRYSGDKMGLDAAAFYTDYDNLLGECTASSGSDCEIGDAFNGDAASIVGLEFLLSYDLSPNVSYSLPLTVSYTYLDAEFDSDVADTDFFGDVSRGDPLPYIPENQALVSFGLEIGKWASYLSANYVDETCVRASCGEFEMTDDTHVLDLAANYRVNDHVAVYGKVYNLTSEETIVGRHPYGARPNMARTIALGVRLSL